MSRERHSGAAARTFWAAAVVVAVVTFVTFLPAIHNDFVSWDDLDNFLNNPHYRGLGWTNIRWMLTTAYGGHYIPVTWLTLGFDYVLWGMDPRGYHLTAILLHTLNAVLFYALAYRLLGLALADRRDAYPTFALAVGAATAALVFSVHPLRVESVAWVTERRDVVAGLFSLLTVLTYLNAWSRGTRDGLRTSWYWGSVGLFALALLSKSIVVGLPAVLLALDLYPMRRRFRLRLLIEKVPFVLVSVCLSVVMLVMWSRTDQLVDLRTLSAVDRLAMAGHNLLFYVLKTLVPWPLSPLYELRMPVHATAMRYVIPSVVAIAISLLLVGFRRQWPAGLTAWTTYVVLLLPVSGVLQNGHHIAADRNTYLACLGWAVLAGAGVAWCVRANGTRALTVRAARLVVALSATTIVSLALLSTLQIRVWRDSETLWQHAIWVDPTSAFNHFHLGEALALFGKSMEARDEFRKAIVLAPESTSVKGRFLTALGRELQKSGELEGAAQHYRAALLYTPDERVALYNLGMIYDERGENQAALDMFVRLLRLAPGQESTCHNVRVLSARLGRTPRELEDCGKDGTSEASGGEPESASKKR